MAEHVIWPEPVEQFFHFNCAFCVFAASLRDVFCLFFCRSSNFDWLETSFSQSSMSLHLHVHIMAGGLPLRCDNTSVPDTASQIQMALTQRSPALIHGIHATHIMIHDTQHDEN